MLFPLGDTLVLGCHRAIRFTCSRADIDLIIMCANTFVARMCTLYSACNLAIGPPHRAPQAKASMTNRRGRWCCQGASVWHSNASHMDRMCITDRIDIICLRAKRMNTLSFILSIFYSRAQSTTYMHIRPIYYGPHRRGCGSRTPCGAGPCCRACWKPTVYMIDYRHCGHPGDVIRVIQSS
jgi:hypothetical protein